MSRGLTDVEKVAARLVEISDQYKFDEDSIVQVPGQCFGQNVYSLKDAETGCARFSIDLLPLKGATSRAAAWMLNKLGEWNITTEQFSETLRLHKFVLDCTSMFLHQCAKQAGTNDDARWGKYLHVASRAIPKGAGYSGHDLVPAAIFDSVSAGLAARPASLAPAGDRKKGTAAIVDKHVHDSLSKSRLAALPASLAPASDPKHGTAAGADKHGHDSVAQ